jgi:hypothetical protein
VRESLYGFQLLVAAHLLGLMLSVGLLLWVDLRLIGASLQQYRVQTVYRSLAPWFLCGFAVMLISGASLFVGFATDAYGNLYFRIKIVALVLAGANALCFHFVTQAGAVAWDDAAKPPALVRVAGFVSIVLWAAVILSGRMISYTMF